MISKVTLKSICVPSENIVARLIEGEIIIVPLVAGIGDADDELYTLNETGSLIWQKLDGKKKLGDVATELIEEYTSTRKEIEADVLGFATAMTERGILSTLD